MKNISTTTFVVSAIILSLVLIIGSNVLSGKSTVVAKNSSISRHVRSASASASASGSNVPTPSNSDNVTVEDSANQIQFAPDFTLKNLDGGTVKLSSYRGDKPVVLDFFATWCPNCQRDMPRLSKMYDKYKDDVEVIGINLRENKNKIERFITKNNITFPIVLDPRGTVSNSYGVRYTNFHVLINKEGFLVGTVPGDISESEIVGLL